MNPIALSLVSVIIPTHQRAHLIRKSIQSVLDQSYNNIEIIVVDDCSSDNTAEVVNAIHAPHIRYLRHDANKGASAARNTGIKNAKGNYIAFQDSDDLWLPGKLERQMHLIEYAPSDVGIVYSCFKRITQGKEELIPYSWVNKRDGDIHDELLKGSFIGLPTILVRKQCFEILGGFDEALPRLQDWELVLRFSKHYRFLYIDDPLLVASSTPNSISENKTSRVVALKHILDKHRESFKKHPLILANYYYSIAEFLCTSKQIEEGKFFLDMAYSCNSDCNLFANRLFIIGRRLCVQGMAEEGMYFVRLASKAKPGDWRIGTAAMALQFASHLFGLRRFLKHTTII
jgi:glycosyltransferase involved in cell wall biosynthesis